MRCRLRLKAVLFLISVVFHAFVARKTDRKKKKSTRFQVCNRTAYRPTELNQRAWLQQDIICSLLANYDVAVRPLGRTHSSDPVYVKTSIQFSSVSAVSDADMEYMAQFRFQQEWFDPRLKFDNQRRRHRTFDAAYLAQDQMIWIPDTFFQNERDGWYHLVDRPNKFTKIRHDGKVTYNRRLTLILSCTMILVKYPMDTQNCLVDFASYAYTTKDIVYDWDDKPITMEDGADEVLPNFTIDSVTNDSCTSVTNTGTYSCLRVEFKLRRVFSYFLLQLYVPSSMLVAVSWVSYWIDWKSTAARVPLAIVTLLTMITQSHAVNSNLAPVGYVKAIDVWIGACVVFIFASLIEYAIVNYTGIREENRKVQRSTSRRRMSTMAGMQLGDEPAPSLGMPCSLIEAAGVTVDISEPSPQLDERSLALSETSALLRKRKTSKQRSKKERSVSFMDSPLGGLAKASSVRQVSFSNADLAGESAEQNSWLRLYSSNKVELCRWCNVVHAKGRAERIDIMSRVLFPVSFFLFNCIYWPLYYV